MQIHRKCPRCDAPISEEAPEGLCTRCLIGDLLVSDYANEIDSETNDDSAPKVLRYFGDYEFIEQISRGGMGTVFKARQISLKRFVAMKLIATGHGNNSGLRKRFQIEAEAAARLHHQHIVPIYEFGEYGGEYFISMKLIEGARSLEDLNLQSRDAVQQLINISQAVHYAHQHGVLHRDIKPSNILVGSDGVAYLTDFGLAKLTASEMRLTLTQEMLGTPAYMAPEQVHGSSHSITTATDVYSLGATLYECLSGRPPFEGENIPNLLRKIIDEEPASFGSQKIDRDLETICLKCLEKDPERRYVSAGALAADLQLWRDGKPIAARPITELERIRKWARRKPASAALAITAALAVFTIVIGVIWFTWRLRIKNREIVQQVIRLNVESGSRLEADRDPSRAMLYFAEALRLAEANGNSNEVKMLRLRFDSLLRRSPQVMHIWTHEGGANDAQFSPDGTQVLTAGNDGAARLWNAETGAEAVSAMQCDAPVLKTIFSPDGHTIATLTQNGLARLWNAKTGLPISDSIPAARSHLWQMGPPCLGFDSRSQFFATAVGNTVHLFDLSTRMHRQMLLKQEVFHVAFRPGGSELAIATESGIEFWNASTCESVRAIPQDHEVLWAEFSEDGQRLVEILRNGKTRILDHLDRDSVSLDLNDPGTTGILQATFARDVQNLCTLSFAGTLRIWDSTTGMSVRSLAVPSLAGFTFLGASDQIALFTLDGAVRFLDSTGAAIGSNLWHGGALTALSVHPDGNRIAVASQDGTVHLWKLPAFSTIPAELYRWQRVSISLTSADAKTQLACGGDDVIHLWDTAKHREISTIRAPGTFFKAALSHNGDAVAAIYNAPKSKHLLSVWNRDGTFRFQVPHSENDPAYFHHVTFSQDGSHIAAAFTRDSAGGAQVLDARTGISLFAVLENTAPTHFVDFDSTGHRLLTASKDGTVRMWDVSTGQPLSPPLQQGGEVSVVRFSPDGGSFVVAGSDDTFLPRYAQIWSVLDFKPKTPRLWHQDGILDAVFSPDGRTLATAGEDEAVRIWNSSSGAPLTPSLPQPAKVDHVIFSPDSQLLLVSCRTSWLRVYHVATGQLVCDPIPFGGSVALAEFTQGSDGVNYAAPDGSITTVPLHPSTLTVDHLRATAELLSHHRLSPLGLERLDTASVLARWRSAH